VTKTTPERQIVEQLQHALAGIGRLPLLTGRLGCQFLDCLELTDKIRTRYRDRVKELLLKEPGAIPNWHVSEVPQRVLSKNTLKVFIAAAHADNGLTAEEFLTACTTSLTALRSMLAERNPDWTPDELERELSRVLADLIHFEKVLRLSRSEDRQFNLSLDDD
jgi:hypothetical protein